MSALLPAIEIETAPEPEFSVLWMHGLGADGNDFVPVIPYLELPPSLRVRFIFPHAPSLAVTCNGGMLMPAWYDIYSLDRLNRTVDADGIDSSRAEIRRWIAHENARGIPTRNIVIAGFSQGGAMAYTVGLTHPEPLAGIIALSAYLPAPEMLTPEALPANSHTPIFAGHGTADDVVGPELGRQAFDHLSAMDYPIAWHPYNGMPHSVCMSELADIGKWLTARLSEA